MESETGGMAYRTEVDRLRTIIDRDPHKSRRFKALLVANRHTNRPPLEIMYEVAG